MGAFANETIKDQHNSKQNDFEEKDVDAVLDDEEKIREKFENKGTLKRYTDDAKILFSLLRDYANGSYRHVPWNIIASIGASLLYVLSPIDLIPDVIPIIGYLDDAAIIAFCLKLIEKDLAAYKVWKNSIDVTES